MPKSPFDLPSPYTRKPKRDSRRAFSPTQKEAILSKQNGICVKCRKKLDPRAIHFHHKKPWSSGGRTTVANGKAVCGTCHEILSHKERLKKVDRKRKKKQPSFFDLPKIELPKEYPNENYWCPSQKPYVKFRNISENGCTLSSCPHSLCVEGFECKSTYMVGI